jgi:hypothetical protein
MPGANRRSAISLKCRSCRKDCTWRHERRSGSVFFVHDVRHQWVSREGEREGWLRNPKNEPDSVRDFSYRVSIPNDVSRIDNAIYRGVMSLLLSRNVMGGH